MNNKQIYTLRSFWDKTGVVHSQPAQDKDLSLFNEKNKLSIPDDILSYFSELNGTNDEYDQNLFRFYSFSQFITIKEELGDWQGPPDYRNIVFKLQGHDNCFVFADHSFHLFTYAIKLYVDKQSVNEVYIICGDEFKIIASSFSNFLNLYFQDDKLLYY